MTFSLQQGLVFKKSNHTFIVEDVMTYSDSFTARNHDQKRSVNFTINEFIREFENKNIIILKNLLDQSSEQGFATIIPNKFTDEEVMQIEERRKWIEACIDENSIWITNKEIRDEQLFEFARSIGCRGKLPSAKTLKRWYTRWRVGGKTMDSLLPHISKRGNRTSRKPDELNDLIQFCISTIYMQENRPCISAVHRVIREKIETEVEFSHLDCPSRSTVEREIKKIPEYERCKSRYGWMIAKRNFPYGSPVKRIHILMELVEIDHTPIDMTCRSNDRTVVLMRIWITIVVEKATRAIVGYYIAAHEPSAISVIRALKSTVTPKDMILARYTELADEYWPCWGLPAEISMDNGTDLISMQVKSCLCSLGVLAHYNPKGLPTYKGCVERLQGTINGQATELMPGRTFSNYIEKGEYKAEMKSVLTIEDMEKIFLIWTVKYYHQTRHSGTKEKPIDAWNRMKEEAAPIRMADDLNFEKFLWKPEEKKLQKYGLDANTFKYNSVELQNIAKKIGYGKTIEVYIDNSDISVVHIRVPGTDTYIDAFAAGSIYMDLHLNIDEHNSVVKQAKQMFNDDYGKPLSATNMSPIQMHTAWLEILRVRDEAINSTKKAVREKEVKRRAKSDSKSPKKSKPETATLTNNHDEQPIIPNIEDL